MVNVKESSCGIPLNGFTADVGSVAESGQVQSVV